MRNNKKLAALSLAAVLTVSLVGCGPSASSAVSSEASSAATGETAVDPLEAAATAFSYSDHLNEDGLFENVKALDYVTLPANYMSMSIPADEIAVSDEDIQTQIDSVLSQNTVTIGVTDRAAQSGDTVNIDFVGTVDGVEFSGGNTNGAGSDLVLGSGSFIDDFEDQVAGHNIGDTFDVTVTFPEGYHDSTDADGNAVVLANQEAVFAVTLNNISESATPELTDEFVAANLDSSYGTTAEEYRATLRRDMETANKESYVLNQLMEESTFAEALPESMTDYFTKYRLKIHTSYASMYGISLNEFLSQYIGYPDAQTMLDESQEDIAIQVKSALIYQAIAEANAVKCSDADLDDYFTNTLHVPDYSDYESFYGKAHLKMNVLGSKAMDTVLEKATVA